MHSLIIKINRLQKLSGITLLILCCGSAFSALNDFDRPLNHPPITLLDEQGQHVLLGNNPYSPKLSCEGSGCHDYQKITHAYHFEMGRDEAKDNYGEVRGLPHLVSPGKFGGYSCMDGDEPQVLAKKNNSSVDEFADYGAAGWVKTCMDCHQGGGWAELDRQGIRYDQKNKADIAWGDGDYYEPVVNPETGERSLQLWDWQKSGVAEADCLLCHIQFSKLRPSRDSGLNKALEPRLARKSFTERGFFRQAATGLLEYMKNTDGEYIVTTERNNGDFALNAEGLPVFNWRAEAFDDNGRIVMPMLRFPENDNCMACHFTSNSRRGFYGFGEDAKQTLAAFSEGGDGETSGAGATLEDDYRDDVHKGTNFTENNGERRSIESCNSCHSAQYYKSNLAPIDLDANHDFPKGNSDMDVRNDLDYRPNLKSCEWCHLHADNAIKGSADSLLETHRDQWKKNGDLKGYDENSLLQITETHFNQVACQTCHILGKHDGDGNQFQIMYRYRTAEDGQLKISAYNPRLRNYWRDKSSGRILHRNELLSVYTTVNNSDGAIIGLITDPMTQQQLGTVGATQVDDQIIYDKPTEYQGYKALKQAYDSLLKGKGFNNPDTEFVLSESNEYVISHNTRAAEDAMPCLDCHEKQANGEVSQALSSKGTLGSEQKKMVIQLPDVRLVNEGIVRLGMPYFNLEADASVTQSVDDILYHTRIDPFMSVFKNSSAREVNGVFLPVTSALLLNVVGVEIAREMQADFKHANSFVFQVDKGSKSIRHTALAINGSLTNDLLIPTLHAELGYFNGIQQAIQGYLDGRQFGKLRSEVYYLNVFDSQQRAVTDFQEAAIYFIAPYYGSQTEAARINLIFADSQLSKVEPLAAENIVKIQAATAIDHGFVIFKSKQTGYFLISDKP